MKEGRDEERLAELAGRIRERDREDQQLANMMLAHAVEKGRWLTEAKSMVPHGEWGAWLKREVDYSQSRAQELMRLFQRYGEDGQESLFGESKSQALGNLSVTQAICLLPLRDGPELEEFLEAHDVEHMSTRELNAEVRAAQRERDEARVAAEQAQAERAAAEAARDKMSQDVALINQRLEGLNDLVERYSAEARERQKALAQANAQMEEQSARAEEAQAEAQRLGVELEELKARPVDVVVETDANALQAARKEAEAAMQAQLDEAKAAAEQARAELMEANSAVQRAKLEQEQARQELERARAEAAALREHPDVEQIKVLWRRFGVARAAAGKTMEECFEAAGTSTAESVIKRCKKLERLEEAVNPYTRLPYGSGSSLREIRDLVNLADLLGVSLDYLLCRTDASEGPAPAQPEGQLGLSGWMPGGMLPPTDCDVVADFDLGSGNTVREPCQFFDGGFLFASTCASIDLPVVRWMALPPVGRTPKLVPELGTGKAVAAAQDRDLH